MTFYDGKDLGFDVDGKVMLVGDGFLVPGK